MKKTIERALYVLKGVSTLDTMMRNSRIILLLLVSIMALSGAIRGGHSTLDYVDPSFNPQIETSLLSGGRIDQIISLPDGKILVSGGFDTYNGVPVGAVVRLNADGTLDTTFTSNLPRHTYTTMRLQADGKILVYIEDWNDDLYQLIRLNADGTLDTTFTAFRSGYPIAIDANGRIILSGWGSLTRLNSDGSVDPIFTFTSNSFVSVLATQNNKIIISDPLLRRLNEDGTLDSSFITRSSPWLGRLIVQPDGKILFMGEYDLQRLNADGSDDTEFPVTTFPFSGNSMALGDDGKITLAINTGNYDDYQIRRLLANGTTDSSFTPYTAVTYNPSGLSFAVQADGGVLVADSGITQFVTKVVRLFPNGSPDPTFNAGGTGFQFTFPGSVHAIDVQPDSKILIGGYFNHVNDVPRSGIARVNADSTLDPSFQINTSGTGNYFSFIVEFSNIHTQSDGKIVVTGYFDYVLGGVTKKNLVRLNSDGSIDPTFILGVTIEHSDVHTGSNRFATFNDGKLLVGASRFGGISPPAVPVKLLATGERDTSFNANIYPQNSPVYIFDVAVQPDGKILVVGQRGTPGLPGKSFLTRLNADGSLDTTFQTREQPDKAVRAFVLLPNGKIVLAEYGNVLRLNPDGSLDPTFNAGTGGDGWVNTMLLLSTGRIFVGGYFSNFNGQPRGYLVQLNENGSVFTPTYNLNGVVRSLAVDANGRVFVGGDFTIINARNCGAKRSFVAALIDASSSNTRFDFDGDGCADISVFRPSDRTWYLNQSTNGFSATQFGLSTDKITPADFDGDGKTDIAVFRDGTWFWLNSSNGNFNAIQFGMEGDNPVPADFTGDGRAELVVYRGGTWWMLNLTGNQAGSVQFGLSSDKPVAADYDGDGRSDFAVYRDGIWYLLQSQQGFAAIHFGISTDKVIPADYDGDGKTDVAVYRDGTWYIMGSSQDFTAFQFGLATDIPAPADYDGDARTDVAVYRDGTWYSSQSTNGMSIQNFGLANDKSVPAAYLP